MIFEAIIVDDEAPARVELTSQLEQTGRVKVVNEAVCLQEAIAKMREGAYDVAFIDHNIAGANTHMLADSIGSFVKTPVLIYMTAYSDYFDEPFGVVPMAYLSKPVDQEKLAQVIAMMDAAYVRKVEHA